MTPQETRELIERAVRQFEEQHLTGRLERAVNRPLWAEQEKEGGEAGKAGKASRKAADQKLRTLTLGIEAVRREFAAELAYDPPEDGPPDARPDARPGEDGAGDGG